MHYLILIAVAAGICGGLVGFAWGHSRDRDRWRLLSIAPAAHTMVFEHMADGVFVLDDRGHVLELNPSACAIFQLTRHEARGGSIEGLLPAWADAIARCRTGAESDLEITLEANTYQLRITSLQGRHRSLSHVVMLRDVTCLRRAEQDLLQAREAAEAANKATYALLSTESHEAHTPMSGAITMTELLVTTGQGPSERHLYAAPVAPAPIESPYPEVCSLDPGQHPGSDCPPRAILLVEDNQLNEELALRMLDRLGYSADVAHDGIEAIEAVRAKQYDVVLMDIHMPRLDGLEASRRIRAMLPPAAQPRIIALTANALSGVREMCLAAGMDDYLSKPVSTQTLQRILHGTPVAEPPVLQPAPPNAANLPTWDPRPLGRLAESLGPTANVLLRELVRSFFAEANQMLPALKGRLAAGDTVTLHRYAHTLKSHGATFGGQSFEALCRELERAVSANDLERAALLIPRVEAEFAELQAALLQALPSEA